MPRTFLKTLLSDSLHLFYPHHCNGCGSDLLDNTSLLCLDCINHLPRTGFAIHENNPIEKYFRGRLLIQAAHSEYYFEKDSVIQELIHQLKYSGNTRIGEYLGEQLGMSLLQSNRFGNLDALIPLPLFPDKERKRGYNQSDIICRGIARVMNIPIITDAVIRRQATETQTHKHRTERWENVRDSFAVMHPEKINNKCMLLVDDVITTGATLEACGQTILLAGVQQLSIATIAQATR